MTPLRPFKNGRVASPADLAREALAICGEFARATGGKDAHAAVAAAWMFLAETMSVLAQAGLLDQFREQLAKVLNCQGQSDQLEFAASMLPWASPEQIATALFIVATNRSESLQAAAVALAVAAARLFEEYPELAQMEAELAEQVERVRVQAKKVDAVPVTATGGQA